MISVASRLDESPLVQGWPETALALAQPSSWLAGTTATVLTAAALLSGTLRPHLAAPLDGRGQQVVAAVAAALSLGVYVTPTGALAGIVWFARLSSLSINPSASLERHPRVPPRTELLTVWFVGAAPATILVHHIWLAETARL